jgi:hypothetical protein
MAAHLRPREQATTNREGRSEPIRRKPAAVECSDGMDSSRDSNGIYVPESPYASKCLEEEESEMHSTTIAVDCRRT